MNTQTQIKPQIKPRMHALTLAALAAATLALGACSRDDDRTAGEKLDSAVAKTEQSATEAKSDIKQGAAELSADAKAAADKAAAAVSSGANKAGDAMEKAADKVAGTVDDAAITASINAELAKDSTLSALRINVDTNGSKVKLSGTAPTAEARDRATRLAQGVKGVTSVDNRLEIRS